MFDADTALVQQIFDAPPLEREADVHHHGQADDFGWSFKVLERIAHHKSLRDQAIGLKPRLI